MTQPLAKDIEFLAHHGIKGMRWGVLKRKESSSNTKTSEDKSRNWKKAATITGAAVGVAAIAAGAYYAKKHFGVTTSDFPGPSKKAVEFTKAIAHEPVGIVHASRGKYQGFTFPQHGGLENPLQEYNKAGFHLNSDRNFVKRYGTRNEKIAARFEDPLGRKDQAGRIIPHEVMLPESMAKGLSTLSEVQRVAWPLIKDVFNALYEKPSEGWR